MVIIRDANSQFGSVLVLKPQFSAETELTAKLTNKTELQTDYKITAKLNELMLEIERKIT
ncbi:hypothetical protein RhiirA5_446383 [Rhizophagus irregularis]|uniref:Uncharacterized protein n=1 Tax=Rhizophagus irregularis TaxID=588596 RepID=A0A2N0NBS4_9GLOM|nr:hypothetical protein RhiirA5_446383 [Rhizophagus irregularis]